MYYLPTKRTNLKEAGRIRIGKDFIYEVWRPDQKKMRSIRSHFEFFLQLTNGMLKARVCFNHVIYRLNGMDDCTVITSTKVVANRFE